MLRSLTLAGLRSNATLKLAGLWADASARAVLIGIVIVVISVASLTVSLWRYQTFANAAAIAVVQVQFNAEKVRQRAMEVATRQELDGIQRTLYTTPETPAAALLRRPSVVEGWQVNRDKELRARIRELEQYRQGVDRILRGLGESPPPFKATTPPWRQ